MANPGDRGAPRPRAEATGGMDGLETKEGGMRALAPKLPQPRQDLLGVGVVTPRGEMLTDTGAFRLPRHDCLIRGYEYLLKFVRKLGTGMLARTVGTSLGPLRMC